MAPLADSRIIVYGQSILTVHMRLLLKQVRENNNMADNQKMWAELGMDLEMHDMLCEVLPGAIGDVFMSQENRPAAMDYFDMVLADVHGLRPSELVEFRKNGGKVFGTFCAYVPDEVIFAAGGIATGLCAGSQFWVPGGERYLPANTCWAQDSTRPARSTDWLTSISERRPATARRRLTRSSARMFRCT